MLRNFPLISLVECFLLSKDTEFCEILCHHQLKLSCVFFFSFVLLMCITLFFYCFIILAFWGKLHLVMMHNSSNMLLDLVLQYFVEYFCNCIHGGYWFVIPYLAPIMSVSGFGIRIMLTSANELGRVLTYFWRSFSKIDINSSLNVW